MWKFIRVGQIALGIFLLALAAGFYFEWSWATALWPWPGYYSSPNSLSFKFLSAVSAALAIYYLSLNKGTRIVAGTLPEQARGYA